MSLPSQNSPEIPERNGSAGSGTEGLSLRLVLSALRRCLPMLRPVRVDLLRFALAVVALAIGGTAAGALLFDLHWTRVLQGEPLTLLEARLLAIDPAVGVHVEALDAATRRSVRNRELVLGVGLAVVLAPLGGALAYYLLWILQRINQELRLELFQRLQRLSLRFHHDSRVGDAIYRLYQDSAMVTDLIQTVVLAPLAQILRFASATALVALLDAKLALLLLLAWPPALLLAAVFTPRLRRGFRHARASNSALTSQIQETLAGARVIKAYGAEAREQRRFEERSQAAFSAAFGARSSFATLGVIAFALMAGAILAATGLATLRTQAGSALFAQRILVVAGFTAWNLGLFSFSKATFGASTQAIERLLVLWARAQDIAVGLDRVFELLDIEPEVRDAPDAIDLAPPLRGVAFHRVGFAYQPGRPALDEVSFQAPCGAVTALLGPTGAGKSTLLALLLRLFDPDRGRIEIDGVDLRRVKVASLRANVSVALQENLLFGTTVRENIRYARPDASEAEVRTAARVACADGFISALPRGYDTLLGERGARLSTGQRQRISIARAVLKDAPILVLDEPTASLDAATELELLHGLVAWGCDRVILLVTHRLSTLRHADRIVFLEQGRVIEAGSRSELMERPEGAVRALLARDPAEPRGEPAGEPA
jgi:ABC-type multidrug transport system fused ATPase/permease subunit